MDILSQILTNTYTIQDVRHRARILKAILENSLFGEKDKEIFSPEDSKWLLTLSPEFVKRFTKENIYSSLQTLDTQIKALKPVILYLTFEPTEEQIERIGTWLKTNLTQVKVFDIKIDPSLLGGIAIVKNGVYKDFSLKSKIEEKGEVILTEFKKYIR